MKRILIIVPELVAPPGLLGQALIENGSTAMTPSFQWHGSPANHRSITQVCQTVRVAMPASSSWADR